MDRDYIGPLGDCEWRWGGFYIEFLSPLRCETARPAYSSQSEGAAAGKHLLSYLPETDDAERAPFESRRLGVLLLVPATLSQFKDIVRDATVDREHQPQSQF